MGNCTNAKNPTARRKSYQMCPEDTGSFDKNSQQKKEFQGCLTNVKIESLSANIAFKSFKIRFLIQDIFDFDLPLLQAIDGKIKWKVDKNFGFSLNDYEMRIRLLKIIIINEEGSKQAQLKINLYRILTGPYHHDFSIGSKSKTGGRLIFDLKISQLVQLKLDVSKVNANLTKQYPGDKFNFVIESNGIYLLFQSNQNSINPIKHLKPIIRSSTSYSCTVPLEKNQKYRPISHLDQAPSPTLRLKRKASNLIKVQTTSSLYWSQLQKNNQMPVLKIKIKASQLLSCIFHLKIFKFVDERRLAQFCQFSFTFSQIIYDSPNGLNNKNKQQKFATIQKNLTCNGKCIGICSMSISATFTKFINQTPNLTQTQDGVINMTHIQLYKIQAHSQQKQYITLQNFLNKIFKLKQQLAVGDDIAQISRLNHAIATQLQKMNQQLIKNWRNSYAFQNEKSKKFKDRKILLLKILKLLSCLIQQNNDISLSQICWKNVVCVVRRGQMLLKYWEFNQQQIHNISRGIVQDSQTKQKIQIGIQYMKTLYHLLHLALNTQIQCTFNQQKQQCQVFKAYCFFRIPIFAKKFLKIVQQHIQENKLVIQKYGIHQNEQVINSVFQVVPSQIDWENKFFKPLHFTEKGSQLIKQITNILDQHQWFDIIVQQDQIYCNFLRYLVGKFSTLKDILKLPRWNSFIGYSILIKGVLKIMCSTQLGLYQNYLIFTAMALLQNEKLIAPMLKILYRKTNLHDQSLVLKLIHILSHFLHVLAKNNKILLNFPYAYMMKGIKQILQTDCSIALSHSVIFLYNFYQHFDSSFRYELSLYLIGSIFWKMFFNWSFNMRRVYYHMIILKIAQDSQLLKTTDIRERLELCCRVIFNAQKMHQERKTKHKVVANQQKIFHEQMKNKLKEKMNNHKDIKTYKQSKKQIQDSNQRIYKQLIKMNSISQQFYIPNYKQSNVDPINDQNSYALMNIQNRIKSNDTDQFQSPVKLKKKTSYLDYKFIYNCFTQRDFEIPPANSAIQQYFEASAKEFKQIIKLVQEHFDKTSCLPHIDLGFKIQIDQKQILPAQFDEINFQ